MYRLRTDGPSATANAAPYEGPHSNMHCYLLVNIGAGRIMLRLAEGWTCFAARCTQQPTNFNVWFILLRWCFHRWRIIGLPRPSLRLLMWSFLNTQYPASVIAITDVALPSGDVFWQAIFKALSWSQCTVWVTKSPCWFLAFSLKRLGIFN